MEIRWECPLCHENKIWDVGLRIGCIKADCPGVPLYSTAHKPGQLEQVVAGLFKRPVPVADPE